MESGYFITGALVSVEGPKDFITESSGFENGAFGFRNAVFGYRIYTMLLGFGCRAKGFI